MSATRLKRFVGLTFAKCRDCGDSAINGYWVESPRGSYALCLGCVCAISSAVNSTSDFVAPVAPPPETETPNA